MTLLKVRQQDSVMQILMSNKYHQTVIKHNVCHTIGNDVTQLAIIEIPGDDSLSAQNTVLASDCLISFWNRISPD